MTRRQIIIISLVAVVLIAGGVAISIFNKPQQQQDDVTQEQTGTDAEGDILPDETQGDIQQKARAAVVAYTTTIGGESAQDRKKRLQPYFLANSPTPTLPAPNDTTKGILPLGVDWVGVSDETALGVIVYLAVTINDQTENQSYIATIIKSSNTWQVQKVEKSDIPYTETEG